MTEFCPKHLRETHSSLIIEYFCSVNQQVAFTFLPIPFIQFSEQAQITTVSNVKEIKVIRSSCKTNKNAEQSIHITPSNAKKKKVAQRATIAHLSPICQGQISFQKTYKWAMETRGPKSNSSEILCLSWLPTTLMTI